MVRVVDRESELWQAIFAKSARRQRIKQKGRISLQDVERLMDVTDALYLWLKKGEKNAPSGEEVEDKIRRRMGA